MSRWVDRADLSKDVRCLPSVLGSDLRGRRGTSLATRFRDWRDSFAVSGLAYLVNEKAWASSAWQLAPARAPKRRRAVATGRRALHLP